MAEISIVEIRQGPIGSAANVTQANMEAAITDAEAFRDSISAAQSGNNADILTLTALSDLSIANSKLATNPLLRSNHTGTQSYTTIVGLGSLATQDGVITRVAVATSDVSRNSTTDRADDPELSLNIGANETWIVEAWIAFDNTASGTPGLSAIFTIPASSTAQYFIPRIDSNVEITRGYPGNFSDNGLLAATGANRAILSGTGVIVNGANAGTFKLQWAQNVSSGSNTTRKRGSWIRATKVS